MIIQTNTYVCDKCGAVTSLSDRINLYEQQPVAGLIEGWCSYGLEVACPECAKISSGEKAPHDAARPREQENTTHG